MQIPMLLGRAIDDARRRGRGQGRGRERGVREEIFRRTRTRSDGGSARDAAPNVPRLRDHRRGEERAISLSEGRSAGRGVPALHVQPAADRPADLRAACGGRPDGAGRRGARDGAAGGLAHPGDRASGRRRPRSTRPSGRSGRSQRCARFALLAVAIACVGLYGTMAYSVARRTNEIGLRMALGAERRRLIWMVLREVFVMAAVGPRDRLAGRAGDDEVRQVVPVRDEAERPVGHRGSGGGAGAGGGGGGVRTGVAGVADRSLERVASRIARLGPGIVPIAAGRHGSVPATQDFSRNGFSVPRPSAPLEVMRLLWACSCRPDRRGCRGGTRRNLSPSPIRSIPG